MDGLSDLVTIAEAARILGLNVATVRHRLAVGTMKGQKVAPRLWLIPRSEVERAAREGRIKPGPRPREGTARREGE